MLTLKHSDMFRS